MAAPTTTPTSIARKTTQVGWSFWLQWTLATWLGFLISLLLVEVGEKPDVSIWEGAIGGVTIGLSQWLVLRQRFDRAIGWLVVNCLIWGLLAGISLGAVGWAAPRTPTISLRVIYGAINGAQVGALVGFTQWLAIRPQVRRPWGWILANMVSWSLGLSFGWAVGGVLRQMTRLFLGEIIGLTIAWAIVAILTGIALVKMTKREG